ncbi:sensor histidine kinase [Longispora sp. NPDC051575]|uniref:sensor histidine kinase n=1 Tax=Longispora sp. NPDC051575 TaxID=3154943 RepID=UPI00344945B2
MSSGHLSHDALFYDTAEDFAAALVPFLSEGLARDHACVVASTPANTALLRHALGADADGVVFLNRDEWYRRPETTVAGWRRLLDSALADGRPQVRIVGEVQFGDPGRHPTWTRYEAALNALFVGTPAWIVCPYDQRGLPSEVLADARRTHPHVWTPRRNRSTHYLTPDELLATTRDAMPAVQGPPQLILDVTGDGAGLRHQLRETAARAGWSSTPRIDELLIAVSEVATVAARHGHRPGTLRVWAHPASVVCEIVSTAGAPTDALLAYRPPPASPGQHGQDLWIAHNFTDALTIDTSGDTTRVRLAITAR